MFLNNTCNSGRSLDMRQPVLAKGDCHRSFFQLLKRHKLKLFIRLFLPTRVCFQEVCYTFSQTPS